MSSFLLTATDSRSNVSVLASLRTSEMDQLSSEKKPELHGSQRLQLTGWRGVSELGKVPQSWAGQICRDPNSASSARIERVDTVGGHKGISRQKTVLIRDETVCQYLTSPEGEIKQDSKFLRVDQKTPYGARELRWLRSGVRMSSPVCPGSWRTRQCSRWPVRQTADCRAAPYTGWRSPTGWHQTPTRRWLW